MKHFIVVLVFITSFFVLRGEAITRIEKLANKIKKTGLLNVSDTKTFDAVGTFLKDDTDAHVLLSALTERLSSFKGKGLPFNKYIFRLFVLRSPAYAFFLAHVCARNSTYCRELAEEFYVLKWVAEQQKIVGVKQKLFQSYRRCVKVLHKRNDDICSFDQFFSMICPCLREGKL